MTRKKSDSHGTIVVKQPGRIRWETTSPEKNLLVSNGKQAWFYRAPFSKDDQGQLIERSVDEVQSDFAKKLLLGSFKFKKETKVEAQADGLYKITPAPGSAGNVKNAVLRIDPKKKLIEGVKLEYEDGNSADIRLTQIELGKKIEDSLFQFTPPPGTVRVQD